MSSKLTFERVRDTFPHWSNAQCFAYVRGVCDAYSDNDPLMWNDGEQEDNNDLIPYYLFGKADAIGERATGEDWFTEIADDWTIEFQWWRD